tara:strand:+ start:44 stop:586 length:543 start_codon:yes stop_codon:yes gene_type:complete
MIDLPAIYLFNVDNDFIDFFSNKINYYKDISFSVNNTDVSTDTNVSTVNGFQTANILKLDENDVIKKLNFLKQKIENKCKCNFIYHWVHLIEYEKGGFQKLHNHEKNEDFSLIIYLNSCSDGVTEFRLNEKRKSYVRYPPEKGRCIMFLSTIYHRALPTTQNKKVLVLGLKFNKNYYKRI